MSDTPMQTAPTGEQDRRTIHLSSYVDLSIDEVVELLSARPYVDSLLERATRVVLGAEEADLALGVSTVVRISRAHASMAVSWSTRSRNQRLVAGVAAVAILLVQSGKEPLTELLLTFEVADLRDRAIARTLHAILDVVTDELARSSSEAS